MQPTELQCWSSGIFSIGWWDFDWEEATEKYVDLANEHGLTPVQLALGYVRDRSFVTSSIIGATSMEQLKENIGAFITARPLSPEVMEGIEKIFSRYRDPAMN
eukprot:Gb_27849 [translate_table: standard]